MEMPRHLEGSLGSSSWPRRRGRTVEKEDKEKRFQCANLDLYF